MKNQFTKKALSGGLCLLAAAGLAFQSTPAHAQVQNYVRNYATRVEASAGLLTGLLGSVSDTANTIDADPSTNGLISSVIGGAPTLVFDYGDGNHIAANTPITVKVTLPGGALQALGGVTVQPIENLHYDNGGLLGLGAGWKYDDVGASVTKSSLLGLLSGNGSFYITVTPSAQYDGVAISMDGVNVVTSMKVFDVFYNETTTNAVDCGAPIDVLSGVGAAVSVASATGSVSDPWDAIDDDTATYAQINTGVQVLNRAYVEPVFSQPAKAGDSVRVVVRTPGQSGLLNVGLLEGFRIQPYMGDSARTEIDNTSSLLNLRLLFSASDKTVITAPVNSTFDRVKFSVGGVVNALQVLHIYEISHIIPAPQMTAAQKDIYVYAGQSANLVATTSNGDDVVWYTDTTRSTVADSTVVIPAGQSDTTLHFYAAAERNGCTDASGLNEANVHVISNAAGTLDSGTLAIPYAGSVAITLGTIPAGFNTPELYYGLIAPGNFGTSPLIYGNGLPDSIALNPATGDLSGTPQVSGTFPLQVTVYDSANNLQVGTFNYDLIVGGTPLSVNWGYFHATPTANHTATLNWQTVNEQENSRFEIQRSLDAKSFETIGQVASHNGNATIAQNYSYIDQNINANTAYYRLRQIDVNGNYSYSRVATVEFGDVAGDVLNITPNPGHDMINLKFKASASVAQVVVSDISGRVVYKSSVNAATMQIPATSGTYYVRVFDANGQVLTTQKAIVK